MNIIRKVVIILAGIMIISGISGCASSKKSTASTTSQGSEKYISFLEERLDIMPESIVLAVGAEAEAMGMDTSSFVDSEGYSIRAKDGEVVIVSPGDAGMDRAVRHFANYGNNDSYTFTYGENYRVGEITIAGNSISEYAVVRPDEDGYADFTVASSELVKYIKLACGVSVPEYTETEYAADPDAPKRIISLAIDYPALGNESFTLEVKENGDLSILGGRYRGCTYGVVSLLKDMGWRFLGVEGADIRRQEIIDYVYEADLVEITSDINRTESPSVANRNNATTLYLDHRFYSNEWCYGTVEKSCHGLQSNDHIFGDLYNFERDRIQPCYTNEDILMCIENYVRKKVSDAGKDGRIGLSFTNVDVAQVDTGAFCNCASCTEVYNYDGVSGAVVQMVNRMADAAKEEAAKYSDETVYVTMLAYHGTNNPPAVTVPRDNVKVAYCFYCGNSKMTCTNHCISGEDCFTSKANKEYNKEFERWCEIAAPNAMQVWYYPSNCYHVGYLTPHNDVFYEDIQYLVDHDVDCIMLCTGGDYNGINMTIAQELMWNADITLEEYNRRTREYFNIFYGSAGDTIYNINNTLLEIGNAADCYTGFFSKYDDKLSKPYFNLRFNDMYTLLHQELELCETGAIETRIEHYLARILYGYLYLNHEELYINGTEETRAEYFELYSEMHALFREHGLHVYNDGMSHSYMPAECDPTEFPT